MDYIMKKANEIQDRFEKEELKSKGLSPIAYKKLFLIYICKQDINSAKFLLCRAPEELKRDADMKTCVMVLRHWQINEFGKALKLLDSHNWSQEIIPFVKLVYCRLSKIAINLIVKIFSSIKVENFETMMGFSSEEVLQICKEYNWKVNGNIVYPSKIENEEDEQSISDEDLRSLAEFTYFLETL